MSNYQNIFNRDFYPTPDSVIESMLSASDIAGKTILEPSFGAENISRWLLRNGAERVVGCEINDRLRNAARDTEVIGRDFLTLTAIDVSHVEMIVMNPPFTRQEQHIMHAWEIAPEGCEIISLCNASMLDNNWSSCRKNICELINLYGYSENLGDVFKEAERVTDCHIACVHLYKPGDGDGEFAGFLSYAPDDEQPEGDGIMTYNEVREAVQRYIGAVGMFESVMEGNRAINALTGELGLHSITFGAHWSSGERRGSEITRAVFKKELQKRAWRWVFEKFDMHRFLTTSVYKQLDAAIEKMQNMPFTMRNVYRLIDMLIQTHAERMNNVILDAFDKICKYSDENVTWHGEKWKTNSAHMVNRKFIVPYICSSCYSWNNHVSVEYSRAAEIDDIVKALCHLTGVQYDETRRLDRFCREMDMDWGSEHYWTFFKIRGFKKGTMHFTFQNEETWYKFNQVVASIRGYELPVKTKGGKKGGGR